MPRGSRRGPSEVNTWPGFVDALASLLLVIIFVLLVFVLTQFYMGQVLSGRNQTIDRLSRQLSELTDMLELERNTSARLKSQIGQLTEQLAASTAERDKLQAQIGGLQNQSAQDRASAQQATAQAALLAQQIEAMKQELARLNAALEASAKVDAEQKVQIADLGKRLNAALASKVAELARYRSEFFGRLRKILGDRPGIRIEGDRFVFQSELLFPSGSADIGPDGQRQLARLAQTLLQVAKEIPKDINWILRIDGHTDKVPIKNDRFPSNWELSTARALAVVKFLVAQGLPPDRLAAAGFGEYQPIDKGSSADALAHNRRIEIRLDQR